MLILTSRTPWRYQRPQSPRLNVSSPLRTGLASYYPCVDGNGTTISDLCGATPLSATAASWKGSDRGIVLTNGANGALNTSPVGWLGTFPATLSLWCNPSDASTTQYILQGTRSSGYTSFLAIALNSTQLYYYQTAPRYVTYTVSANRWIHVAFVFTSSTEVHAYIDGVERFVSQPSGAFTLGPAALYLGAIDGGASYVFSGRLSDAGFWNRALSPSEVWSLYDPSTRWSLYQPLIRRVYFDLGAAPSGFNPAWALRISPMIGTGLR